MKNALVVIDVQNFFVNENTEHIPKKIAHAIEENEFNFILFTKYVGKEGSNFSKILGHDRPLGPPDTDIHEDLLELANKNNVFEKTSYSIFKSDKLVEFLEKNSIRELYLCGMDIDACILASAFEAFDLGYTPHILKDLSASHAGKEFSDAAFPIIRKNLEKKP